MDDPMSHIMEEVAYWEYQGNPLRLAQVAHLIDRARTECTRDGEWLSATSADTSKRRGVAVVARWKGRLYLGLSAGSPSRQGALHCFYQLRRSPPNWAQWVQHWAVDVTDLLLPVQFKSPKPRFKPIPPGATFPRIYQP